VNVLGWMARQLCVQEPIPTPEQHVSNLRARLREMEPGEYVTFSTIEQARSAAAGACHLYGKTFRRSGQTIERLS
jgi:hypothetical protein